MKNFFSVLVIVSLVLAPPAFAKKKQKNQKHSESGNSRENQTNRVMAPVYENQAPPKESWLKIQLTIPEKGILFRHANAIKGLCQHPQTQNLPPGLAKKVARGGRLPPGWERKLAAGRIYPQNVYQQSQPIPVYIIQELPPQPEGTILMAVNGKVVRLYEATKTIIDVLDLNW